MSAEDYRAKSDSIEEMLSRKDFFNENIDNVIRKNDKNKNDCIDMTNYLKLSRNLTLRKLNFR